MNNSGITRFMAMVIILAITISTFVGVFAFSLVESNPPNPGALNRFDPVGVSWLENSLAVRITLTEDVEIGSVKYTMSFMKDVPNDVYCFHQARLNQGPFVMSGTVITFEEIKEQGQSSGNMISADADVIDSGSLLEGEYYLEVTLMCPAPYYTAAVDWAEGTRNVGDSGYVNAMNEEWNGNIQEDYDHDGRYSGELRHYGPAFSLLGVEQTGNGTEPDGGEEQDLVGNQATSGTTVVDTELASNVAIIGLLMLILGFAFLAVGTKTHFAIVLLGIIFLIIALLLIAWASFALYGGLT